MGRALGSSGRMDGARCAAGGAAGRPRSPLPSPRPRPRPRPRPSPGPGPSLTRSGGFARMGLALACSATTGAARFVVSTRRFDIFPIGKDLKLQAKTRYGVRAVFDLAYHNAGSGATQAKDIARRE